MPDGRDGSERYEVGYGHPPREHRFTKGKSGNPRGRPKKKRSAAELVDKKLSQKMDVQINGQKASITVVEGIVHTLAQSAMKGSLRAAEMLLQYRDIQIANIASEDHALVEGDEDIINRYLGRREADAEEPACSERFEPETNSND